MDGPVWGHLTWTVEDGFNRSRRYGVTLLGPLMAVNCSRRYGVTLLGSLTAVELADGLRRDTQVAVFAQLQVAQLQDASG